MLNLHFIQILTAVFAVITICLIIVNQPQSGDTFGSKDSFISTRRGFEKQIHTLTVVSAAILVALVVGNLILK